MKDNFKLIGKTPNIEFFYYADNSHIGYMSWAKKISTNNQYNKAGKIISDKAIEDNLKDKEYELLNNWRAIHAYPLIEITSKLSSLSESLSIEANIVHRTKRLDSILPKLDKYGLTQIQDIAGCRVIISKLSELYSFRDSLMNSFKFYELFGVDDYIDNPKESGYRGIHLVYKYKSHVAPQYDGLKVEIQLRTGIQHAWATSVEMIDLFTNQTLKASTGNKDWHRFFSLVSSYVALVESCPIVPNTPNSYADLRKEILELENKLQVINLVISLKKSFTIDIGVSVSESSFYLIEIEEIDRLKKEPSKTRVTVYEEQNYNVAIDHYIKSERELLKKGGNAVLVSGKSIKSIREAYPNYFSDFARMTILLEIATGKN